MDKLIAFLHNTKFVTGVTWVAFVLALFLTGLAGFDIKNIGKDMPNEISKVLLVSDQINLDSIVSNEMKKDKVDSSFVNKLISIVEHKQDSLNTILVKTLISMLKKNGIDSLTFEYNTINLTIPISEFSKWDNTKNKVKLHEAVLKRAKKESRKTPVAHLARLVSGFSSCIFLLMFLFLYQKKRKSEDENEQSEPDDYSMLFFGLAMLTWSLPTEQVFRVYGFESFARALDDSRAFLNSIFLICAYWDMEYKIPGKWKSFLSFSTPVWWKKFIGKYSKRGTFVFLTVLLTTVILILFFAEIAHTKIDDNDISWYDFFDFFFSVGFSLLFIVAIIFGFHKRIRYSENDNSIGIGLILGLFIASGFVVVVLFYAVDNPLGWKPPQPLKDLVETNIFQLIYQFLILFSVSFLAFSGAYSQMVQVEIEKSNQLLAQKQEIKHFTRNLLTQFQEEIRLRFSQTPDSDTFKKYIESMVEDIIEYLQFSIIATASTKINLPERLNLCIDKFKKIYSLQFNLNINLLNESNYDAENSLKLIQVVNELMFNAKKHGGGIEFVSIKNEGNAIIILVKNKTNPFSEEFNYVVKTGFNRKDVNKLGGQGAKTLYWLLHDLDQNRKISIETKSITIIINKNTIQK